MAILKGSTKIDVESIRIIRETSTDVLEHLINTNIIHPTSVMWDTISVWKIQHLSHDFIINHVDNINWKKVNNLGNWWFDSENNEIVTLLQMKGYI